MTIERPMFPPAADERCQIIQFSAAARVSLKRCKSIVRAAGTSRMARVELDQEPERPARDEGELSTTCKNSRLRQARDKAWDRASQTTSYWRARLDWHGDLEYAQKWGLADSGSFPPAGGYVVRSRTALLSATSIGNQRTATIESALRISGSMFPTTP
jgi:hypothetical protein